MIQKVLAVALMLYANVVVVSSAIRLLDTPSRAAMMFGALGLVAAGLINQQIASRYIRGKANEESSN